MSFLNVDVSTEVSLLYIIRTPRRDVQLCYVMSLGEAEREILTLAPHFEAKPAPESFDIKMNRLQMTAREDLTWLHLLSKTDILVRGCPTRRFFIV